MKIIIRENIIRDEYKIPHLHKKLAQIFNLYLMRIVANHVD
jgi:hypothetical protein